MGILLTIVCVIVFLYSLINIESLELVGVVSALGSLLAIPFTLYLHIHTRSKVTIKALQHFVNESPFTISTNFNKEDNEKVVAFINQHFPWYCGLTMATKAIAEGKWNDFEIRILQVQEYRHHGLKAGRNFNTTAYVIYFKDWQLPEISLRRNDYLNLFSQYSDDDFYHGSEENNSTLKY